MNTKTIYLSVFISMTGLDASTLDIADTNEPNLYTLAEIEGVVVTPSTQVDTAQSPQDSGVNSELNHITLQMNSAALQIPITVPRFDSPLANIHDTHGLGDVEEWEEDEEDWEEDEEDWCKDEEYEDSVAVPYLPVVDDDGDLEVEEVLKNK